MQIGLHQVPKNDASRRVCLGLLVPLVGSYVINHRLSLIRSARPFICAPPPQYCLVHNYSPCVYRNPQQYLWLRCHSQMKATPTHFRTTTFSLMRLREAYIVEPTWAGLARDRGTTASFKNHIWAENLRGSVAQKSTGCRTITEERSQWLTALPYNLA